MSNDAAPDKPAPRKGLWESVISLTPVVMTILATLLAGLSSSEMTQAMYHRSVAGQNQSKAGDQWGFFQAKRIRGNELELATDRQPITAKLGKLEPAVVRAAADRLTRALGEVEKQATALAASTAGKPDLEPLHKAAQALADRLRSPGATPKDLRGKLDDVLRNEAVFAYLGTQELPKPRDPTADDPRAKEALTDKALAQVTDAIRERKSADEIAKLVRPVPEPTLHAAIEAAEVQALAGERASDPVDDQMNDLLKRVDGLVRLTALCHLVTHEAEALPPTGGDQGVRDTSRALIQAEASARSAAEDLSSLVRAARYDYTARRYKREAANNLRTAMLYEAQVHKSSANSDSHRTRSQFFFFGMLGAQAAMAIASLSLAARQKSLLWALAALAGIGAVVFSGWVFLSM